MYQYQGKCLLKGKRKILCSNFFLNRDHIVAEIALLAMKVMDELVRQAPYAPISSAVITVSAMKTPNVFSIQTVHPCVSAELDLLAMASVQMDVSRRL